MLGAIRRPHMNSTYYSTTASSLNKRPLSAIYDETAKKKTGERSALQNPSTKKVFKYITSKIDHGVKKKNIAN